MSSRRAALTAALVAAGVALSACGSSDPAPAANATGAAQGGKLAVVASFYPLAYAVEQVGGDKVDKADPFGQRDTRPPLEITPGSEAPIVGGTRSDPSVEQVREIAGKIFATDQEIRRNQVDQFERRERQLANSLAVEMEDMVIAKLNAEVDTARGAATTVPTWKITSDPTQVSQANEPFAGLVKVQAQARTEQLGVQFDTLVLHPNDAANLLIFYGDKLQPMLDFAGIKSLRQSMRQTEGTAMLVASGQAGALLYENGHAVERWRENAVRTEWVEHRISPVIVIDNPMAAIKLQGLSA